MKPLLWFTPMEAATLLLFVCATLFSGTAGYEADLYAHKTLCSRLPPHDFCKNEGERQ